MNEEQQPISIHSLTSDQLKDVIIANYTELGMLVVQNQQRINQLLELNALYVQKQQQEASAAKQEVLNLPKLKKLNLPRLGQSVND